MNPAELWGCLGRWATVGATALVLFVAWSRRKRAATAPAAAAIPTVAGDGDTATAEGREIPLTPKASSKQAARPWWQSKSYVLLLVAMIGGVAPSTAAVDQWFATQRELELKDRELSHKIATDFLLQTVGRDVSDEDRLRVFRFLATQEKGTNLQEWADREVTHTKEHMAQTESIRDTLARTSKEGDGIQTEFANLKTLAAGCKVGSGPDAKLIQGLTDVQSHVKTWQADRQFALSKFDRRDLFANATCIAVSVSTTERVEASVTQSRAQLSAGDVLDFDEECEDGVPSQSAFEAFGNNSFDVAVRGVTLHCLCTWESGTSGTGAK